MGPIQRPRVTTQSGCSASDQSSASTLGSRFEPSVTTTWGINPKVWRFLRRMNLLRKIP
jgi:hypothetical protein